MNRFAERLTITAIVLVCLPVFCVAAAVYFTAVAVVGIHQEWTT